MSTPDIAKLKPRVTVTAEGVTVEVPNGSAYPGEFDFEVVQGGKLDLRITWVDSAKDVLDLTASYTAALKIKDRPGATTTHASLTDSDGITLRAASPNIQITRTAAETAAYTGWLRATYDLEMTVGGATQTLLRGVVTLRQETTA
jgi:hypothetical protein